MKDAVRGVITAAIAGHRQMMERFEADCAEAVAAAADMLTAALSDGRRVYICGNGGSAADAQHIAAELVGRFRRERPAIPAAALTTDTSVITSVSNDYGYRKAFTRQVEAFVRKGDVLWVISTNGASENINDAVDAAKQAGAKVLAFAGAAGTDIERAADVCLCAGSGETARIQEVHQLAYHIICDIVEERFS